MYPCLSGIHLSSFFPLPPSCFLPGLKVDVEKLEQNTPCCKASDALASIILGGGRGWGSRECAVGILGALIFFLVSLVLSTWGATRGAHTLAHTHTSQLWEHGANSSGTEATKSWGFIVEITTGSLHEEFLLFFFSVLPAGRTVVLFFSRIPPNEEDGGEGGVCGFGQCVFLYWRQGIWAGGRTAGGLLYNTKFCIGTGKIFFVCPVFLIC